MMKKPTFNRTSLELKPFVIPLCFLDSCLSFNRTSLELKHFSGWLPSLTSFPFNRTSLELKLQFRNIGGESAVLLLIAPVWN